MMIETLSDFLVGIRGCLDQLIQWLSITTVPCMNFTFLQLYYGILLISISCQIIKATIKYAVNNDLKFGVKRK